MSALEEGTREQLGHWRSTLRSGAQRVGWKIGFNVPAVREKLGLERPAIGHITSATLVGATGTHSLAGARNPLVEPEIAVEAGPGGQIAGLAPAIEVIDMPALPSDPSEVHGVVAHNIFHRAAALGRSRPGGEQDGIEAVLTVDGEVAGAADVSDYDLAGMLAVVRESLEAVGERLETGDRVIAGTLTPPVPVKAGSRVALEAGPLGRVEIEFTH